MKRSVLLSLLALIAVAVGAPLIGSTHVSLTRALAGISPDHEILFYARLPRVLLALLAGAALSVTGVLFQCMLRDPLAEPYTLGVSSGSSVGTVLAISLGFRASPWRPWREQPWYCSSCWAWRWKDVDSVLLHFY